MSTALSTIPREDSSSQCRVVLLWRKAVLLSSFPQAGPWTNILLHFSPYPRYHCSTVYRRRHQHVWTSWPLVLDRNLCLPQGNTFPVVHLFQSTVSNLEDQLNVTIGDTTIPARPLHFWLQRHHRKSCFWSFAFCTTMATGRQARLLDGTGRTGFRNDVDREARVSVAEIQNRTCSQVKPA